MGDMNWLSLEDAEQLFFATADEILQLVSAGEIEAKEIQEGDKTYLRVMEIHMEKKFHRRERQSFVQSSGKEIGIGAAAGVAAASIYDVAKFVINAVETSNTAEVTEPIDPPEVKYPRANEFPRSYLLEQTILSISSKISMPVRQQLLRAIRRSLDYREIGTTDLTLDILANSSLSEVALIENRIIIDRLYFLHFLRSFGWPSVSIGEVSRPARMRFVGLDHGGREYYTYIEWIYMMRFDPSRDVHDRLDYHIALVDHYLRH